MQPLQGKLALVTGASRGIGRAVLAGLAQEGAVVVGSATTEAGALNISKYLEENKWPGMGVVMNVTQPDTIEACYQHIRDKCQQDPAILINNAGITQDNLALRMSIDEWDKVINTNLTGVFRLTKMSLRSMIKARWGRIISIGSVVGTMGNPGQANYAAAKAGLLGFSKSLALEVASRFVTVNVVAPGFVETDMTHALTDAQKEAAAKMVPIPRFAKPDEIAHAVKFLASPQAGYITGETINVNGGLYRA